VKSLQGKISYRDTIIYLRYVLYWAGLASSSTYVWCLLVFDNSVRSGISVACISRLSSSLACLSLSLVEGRNPGARVVAGVLLP
jgi:hypothetical protein